MLKMVSREEIKAMLQHGLHGVHAMDFFIADKEAYGYRYRAR